MVGRGRAVERAGHRARVLEGRVSVCVFSVSLGLIDARRALVRLELYSTLARTQCGPKPACFRSGAVLGAV